MSNLYARIKALHPAATERDFTLRDDGTGPYIAHWDEAKLGPRPTQEELDAVDVAKIEHNAGIDAQIAAHEQRELAPRFNREATLVMLAKFYMAEKSVDFATAVSQMTTVGHAGYNAGFTKLKALDDTIRALRAQRQP
jgi:hypothetical protein